MRELPEKINQILTKAIDDISKELEKEEFHEQRHLKHTIDREFRFRFRDVINERIRKGED